MKMYPNPGVSIFSHIVVEMTGMHQQKIILVDYRFAKF